MLKSDVITLTAVCVCVCVHSYCDSWVKLFGCGTTVYRNGWTDYDGIIRMLQGVHLAACL